MNKNILTASGIVLALILGTLGFLKQSTVVIPAEVVAMLRKQGSVSGPDIQSPYFSFGGLHFWSQTTNSLPQATTTVCAIQSPTATSTLISASFIESSTTAASGSLSGIRFVMAKSATAFASTTKLGELSITGIPMNFPLMASSTPVATDADDHTFKPSTYLTVSAIGAVGYNMTGSCSATWVQVTDN